MQYEENGMIIDFRIFNFRFSDYESKIKYTRSHAIFNMKKL